MTKASMNLQDLRRRIYVKAKAEKSWPGEKYRKRVERLKLGEAHPRQLNHFLGSHGARPSALCLLKLGKKDVDAATSPGMMVER
jgi:hypothetical protein